MNNIYIYTLRTIIRYSFTHIEHKYRLESCHGIEWSLVIGSIQVPKEKFDEQFSIQLVACEWTLVMGSNGLLSLDRLESCHVIDWSPVMGSIGLLSWASGGGGLLALALPHQRLSTKACARA